MKQWFFFLVCISTPLLGKEFVVVDPYMSPFAGAHDILFVHNEATTLTDRYIASSHKRSTLSAWGRSLEQLIWNQVNTLSAITQHEVFGHGYRLRELGCPPKKYKITLEGGYTKFSIPMNKPAGDLTAITIAGLEAEAILAEELKYEWMRTKKIDGRLSSLYAQTAQSLFWYTTSTLRTLSRGNEPSDGNDVYSYVLLLNETYPHHPTSVSVLSRWAFFNFFDPMTFYAYFSWFYYIATGEPWAFPTISLKKGVDYLPNIRIGYAPYGPEAYLENFFSLYNKPASLYLKAGPRSAGLGLCYKNFLSLQKYTMGIRFDTWLQSAFSSKYATISDLDEGYSVAINPHYKIGGLACSLMHQYAFSRSSLFLEIGGKTKGYLPGYTLKNGMTLRLGISAPSF